MLRLVGIMLGYVWVVAWFGLIAPAALLVVADYWANLLGFPSLGAGSVALMIRIGGGSFLAVTGVLIIVWSTWTLLAKGGGSPFGFFSPSSTLPRRLVVSGPYKLIRNPILAGYWLYLLGLALWVNPITGIILVVLLLIPASVVYVKWVEEPKLERLFGQEHAVYCSHTPMFVPWTRRTKIS